MATTQNLFNGNGSLTTFTYTFPTLKDADVKAEVNGTITTAFTLLTSPTRVQFSSAPGTGTNNVRIYRDTDVDTAKAVFAAGSSIKATDLNNNMDQLLYAAQEEQGATITTHRLADNAVTTAKLADDAVSQDKLGDDSVNSRHIVTNAVLTPNINDDAVTTVKLDDDAVTQDKLGDDSVNSRHIVTNAVLTPNINDDAVTTVKIENGAVINSKLGPDAVNGAKIADNAIDSEHYVDGSIDAIHIADNQVTIDKIDDSVIVLNSEQAAHTVNDTSFFTTAAAEARYFNASTSETIKDGQSFPDNDTSIATTAAINDRIIDLVDDVGGFVPIANETSFPNANPDVNNGAGTLVSIKALASNHTSNGSGVISVSNGTVGNSTVTINGADNSTTYSAGFGMILETTTTLNTYTFHRLVPKATEVTTVAGKATEIGRLGTADAVADMAILGTTDVVADLNTLGTADVVSDLNTLGTADVVSDMNTLAVTAVVNNMSTCATNITNVNTVGNNIANVNTAATNIAKITTVADDLNEGTSEIDTVATNITNVNNVGSNIASIDNCNTNLTAIEHYGDTYQIGTGAPTQRPDGTSLVIGDLWFDSSSNKQLMVRDGSSGDGYSAASPSQSVLTDIAIVSGNITYAEDLGSVGDALTTGTGNSIETAADNIANIQRLGTADAVADMAILGTTDVVADLNTLGTAAIVADMNLLGTADCVADMALLATTDCIADMALLGTTDAIADMALLGTADCVADMAILGTADVVADLNTLGTADVVADLNTLGTADVVADLNTLGTADVVSDMNTLATSANVTAMDNCSGSIANINTTAGSIANVNTTAGAITNVNNVGGSISNVNTVAGSIADVNRYANEYKIASNAPGSPSEGDLWYDDSNNILKYRSDSAWESISSGGITSLSADTSPQLGGNLDVNTKNIVFADSAGATDDRLTFGSGTDFSIYHDGTHSILNNAHATGLTLLQVADGEAGIQIIPNGAVELFHNNVKKLETTATGTTVTGLLTATTIDGSAGSNLTLDFGTL